MLATDCVRHIERSLAGGGVGLTQIAPDAYVGDSCHLADAWTAFADAAAEPVVGTFRDPAGTLCHVDPDPSGDRLIFEAAVGHGVSSKGYGWGPAPTDPVLFLLYFTRQLAAVDDCGNLVTFLGCTMSFEFPLVDELRTAAPAQVEGDGGPLTAKAWVDKVASHPSFIASVGSYAAHRLVLGPL